MPEDNDARTDLYRAGSTELLDMTIRDSDDDLPWECRCTGTQSLQLKRHPRKIMFTEVRGRCGSLGLTERKSRLSGRHKALMTATGDILGAMAACNNLSQCCSV